MKFRTKVILGFMVIVLVNGFVLSASCKFWLKPIFIRDSRSNMEKYGSQVEEVLKKSDDEILEFLSSANVDYAIQSYILNEDLDVLYTHLGEGTKIWNSASRRIDDMIRSYEASGRETFIEEHYDTEDHCKRLYYIRRTGDGLYIIMNKTIRGIEQDIRIMTRFLYIAILVLTVCCIILWYVLTRGFTRRMESMSRVTKKMSELDFGEKVNYRGSDEIGVLAESIDHLSDKLQESIEGMRRELDRKKELIRNLSHELKTPVTAIRGYAENTRIAGKGEEKINRYCEIIIEECDTLDLLAGEMLDLSALEEGENFYEMEELDTGELFEEIRRRAEREFPCRRIEICRQVCALKGNRFLLERAVCNYLSNADKYGTPGEPVTLEGSVEGSDYVFAVTNSGREIPPEELERIWDIFYKTDKSRKRSAVAGYGIGLSIVKKIAELHGGGVSARCKDGKTTFFLRIPVRP